MSERSIELQELDAVAQAARMIEHETPPPTPPGSNQVSRRESLAVSPSGIRSRTASLASRRASAVERMQRSRTNSLASRRASAVERMQQRSRASSIASRQAVMDRVRASSVASRHAIADGAPQLQLQQPQPQPQPHEQQQWSRTSSISSRQAVMERLQRSRTNSVASQRAAAVERMNQRSRTSSIVSRQAVMDRLQQQQQQQQRSRTSSLAVPGGVAHYLHPDNLAARGPTAPHARTSPSGSLASSSGVLPAAMDAPEVVVEASGPVSPRPGRPVQPSPTPSNEDFASTVLKALEESFGDEAPPSPTAPAPNLLGLPPPPAELLLPPSPAAADGADASEGSAGEGGEEDDGATAMSVSPPSLTLNNLKGLQQPMARQPSSQTRRTSAATVTSFLFDIDEVLSDAGSIAATEVGGALSMASVPPPPTSPAPSTARSFTASPKPQQPPMPAVQAPGSPPTVPRPKTPTSSGIPRPSGPVRQRTAGPVAALAADGASRSRVWSTGQADVMERLSKRLALRNRLHSLSQAERTAGSAPPNRERLASLSKVTSTSLRSRPASISEPARPAALLPVVPVQPIPVRRPTTPVPPPSPPPPNPYGRLYSAPASSSPYTTMRPVSPSLSTFSVAATAASDERPSGRLPGSGAKSPTPASSISGLGSSYEAPAAISPPAATLSPARATPAAPAAPAAPVAADFSPSEDSESAAAAESRNPQSAEKRPSLTPGQLERIRHLREYLAKTAPHHQATAAAGQQDPSSRTRVVSMSVLSRPTTGLSPAAGGISRARLGSVSPVGSSGRTLQPLAEASPLPRPGAQLQAEAQTRKRAQTTGDRPRRPSDGLSANKLANKYLSSTRRRGTPRQGANQPASAQLEPPHSPRVARLMAASDAESMASGTSSTRGHRKSTINWQGPIKPISVVITRTSPKEPLGLTLVGGPQDPVTGRPVGVFVKAVKAGGAAARDGRVKPGDQIQEVDGTNTMESALKDVTAKLSDTATRVRLTLARRPRVPRTTAAGSILEASVAPEPALSEVRSRAQSASSSRTARSVSELHLNISRSRTSTMDPPRPRAQSNAPSNLTVPRSRVGSTAQRSVQASSRADSQSRTTYFGPDGPEDGSSRGLEDTMSFLVERAAQSLAEKAFASQMELGTERPKDGEVSSEPAVNLFSSAKLTVDEPPLSVSRRFTAIISSLQGLGHSNELSITWDKLTVTIPGPRKTGKPLGGLFACLSNRPRHQALIGVSGTIQPGQSLVVLANPPLAGTALLNVLSGKPVHGMEVEGTLECNQQPVEHGQLAHLGAQVALVKAPWRELESSLSITAHLTVTAELSHRKNLPNRHGAMAALVNCCLHVFHLYRLRDTPCSSPRLTKLERRRVLLAELIASRARLILLDGLLQGLDSAEALTVAVFVQRACVEFGVSIIVNAGLSRLSAATLSCFRSACIIRCGYNVYYGATKSLSPYLEYLGHEPQPGVPLPIRISEIFNGSPVRRTPETLASTQYLVIWPAGVTVTRRTPDGVIEPQQTLPIGTLFGCKRTRTHLDTVEVNVSGDDWAVVKNVSNGDSFAEPVELKELVVHGRAGHNAFLNGVYEQTGSNRTFKRRHGVPRVFSANTEAKQVYLFFNKHLKAWCFAESPHSDDIFAKCQDTSAHPALAVAPWDLQTVPQQPDYEPDPKFLVQILSNAPCLPKDLAAAYSNSTLFKLLQAQMTTRDDKHQGTQKSHNVMFVAQPGSNVGVGTWAQFVILQRAAFRDVTTAALASEFLSIALCGILVGLLFRNHWDRVAYPTDCAAGLPFAVLVAVVFLSMVVTLRRIRLSLPPHRGAASSPVALISVALINDFVLAAIAYCGFSLCVVFASGNEGVLMGENFAWLWLVASGTSVFVSSVARLYAATGTKIDVWLKTAATVVPLLLLAGFLAQGHSAQIWTKILHKISPFSYAYEALAHALLRGKTLIYNDQTLVTGGDYLCSQFDMGCQASAQATTRIGLGVVVMPCFMLAAALLFIVRAKRRGWRGVVLGPPLNTCDEGLPIETRSDGSNTALQHKVPDLPVCDQAVITWENLSCVVDSSGSAYVSRRVHQHTSILSGVSGYCQPKSVLCVFGPSGSGKSTLLRILAGRARLGRVSGTVQANGLRLLQGVSQAVGFTAGCRALYPKLTVKENLMYSVAIRCPAFKAMHRLPLVCEVAELTELMSLLNETVEDLSDAAAPRKLAVAVEILTSPAVLVLDDLFAGLEPAATKSLASAVRRVADHGVAVICSVDRISGQAFGFFDHVLMLESSGKQAFFGPAGSNLKGALRYFKEKGMACGEGQSTADSLLLELGASDVVAPTFHWSQLWQESSEYKSIIGMMRSSGFVAGAPLGLRAHPSAHWLAKTRVMTWRMLVALRRTRSRLFLQVAILFATSLFVGLLFAPSEENQQTIWQTHASTLALSCLTFLWMVYGCGEFERSFQLCEDDWRSGLFSTGSFLVVAWVPSTLSLLFGAVASAGIVFGLARFHEIAFATLWLLVTLVFWLGMIVGGLMRALSSTKLQAVVRGTALLTLWMLLSGVFVSQSYMPHWLRWLSYGSPFLYLAEGILVADFRGATVTCDFDSPLPCMGGSEFLALHQVGHATHGHEQAMLLLFCVAANALLYAVLEWRRRWGR